MASRLSRQAKVAADLRSDPPKRPGPAKGPGRFRMRSTRTPPAGAREARNNDVPRTEYRVVKHAFPADREADPMSSDAVQSSPVQVPVQNPAEVVAVAAGSAAAAQPAAMSVAVPAPGGVLGGREQIDAVDAQIATLIQRRIEISHQIQAARLQDGGRRVDLRRETEIIGRYTTALGRPGTTIAMALLELGRGRA